MPLVLNRVDDRLIHGQVVLGWGSTRGIQRIVLVDDTVRESPWEQDLYRMAVPASIDLVFASLAEAAAALSTWHQDPRKTILLTGSIEAMAALHDAAPGVVREINLGGLHYQQGRTQVLRYLFLTPAERELLRGLAARGASVTALDVPGGRPVPVQELS